MASAVLLPCSFHTWSVLTAQVLNIVSGKPVAAGEVASSAYTTSSVGPARGYAKAWTVLLSGGEASWSDFIASLLEAAGAVLPSSAPKVRASCGFVSFLPVNALIRRSGHRRWLWDVPWLRRDTTVANSSAQKCALRVLEFSPGIRDALLCLWLMARWSPLSARSTSTSASGLAHAPCVIARCLKNGL